MSTSEIMQTIGGATPLMYACQQCRENEVSDILLKQPYSARDRDRTLKTPLHYCAENPNAGCAEALLKAAPELVNAQDENGYCSLHLAVIAGNKPLIKLLVAKGADVNVYDNEGHSAVHWAIVSSEKEALEMIIRAGANPSTADIHGGYPLHYAVQMCGSGSDCLGNSEDTIRVVETLLNFGVDVNVKDKDGRQPILWAASAGSPDAVIHLVSGGACVEAADKDGLTALHCAASRGHTSTLETLVTLCGANVDVIDGNGCSALFYSVTLGHADATELLLGLGAEPNRQDRKGRTPAHCGAAKGQLETLRILQKHGGNLWLRNVKGDIPLHEAVASGRKDLVLWLLSQNSEAVNISNNDGRSPLHIAAMYNNTEMVKVLLDAKSLVNPVMRTSKGVLMTPLNVALCRGHRSCGKYLQLHGGVPFSKVSTGEPFSVVAVRISPSDEMMDQMAEASVENLTPSPGRTSRDKTSTDVQVIEEESADKKKVYRRRKKKRSSSNVENRDSDSDESVEEFAVKARAPRRNGKGGGGDNGEEKRAETKKVQPAGRGRDKPKNEKPGRGSDPSVSRKAGKEPQAVPPRKEEKPEEKIAARAVGKAAAEPRPLPRNKSLGEHKTVSNLSPEDFPPLMQTINHLDAVTLEPEIDVGRALTENDLRARTPNPAAGNSGDANPAERKEDDAPGSETEAAPALPPPESSNSPDAKGDEEKKEREEEPPVVKEDAVEKPQEEKSLKSPGPRSSNDEGSGRKVEKSVKFSGSKGSAEGGSFKKEEKSSKPGSRGSASGGSDGGEKTRKTPSPKGSMNSSGSGSSRGAQKENAPEVEERPQSAKAADEPSPVEKEDNPGELPAANNPAPEESPEAKAPVEAPLEEVRKSEEIFVKSAAEPAEPPKETEEKAAAGAGGGSVSQDQPSSAAAGAPDSHEDHATLELSVTANAEGDREEILRAVVAPENRGEAPAEVHGVPWEEAAAAPNEFLLRESGSASEMPPPTPNAPEEEGKPIETPEPPPEADTRESTKPPGSHRGVKAAEEETEPPHSDADPTREPDTADQGALARGEPPETHPARKGEDSNSPRRDAREVSVGQGEFRTPRVSRLCRRHGDSRDDFTQISVNQLVQNTIRKYHMERGIFYQLLELKRLQIRAGRANEQVLVKRLADDYERSRAFTGMKHFTGVYRFKEFEKFLYDQLKALNARRSFIIPEIKSYDDIDALSGFLKKSRFKIISDVDQPESLCTRITQRCHHSACAYTSVPCSAYVANLRRHKPHRPRRECFFPRIDQTTFSKPEKHRLEERPATLELIQGSEKHVITLPENSPNKSKRYYITFTIKGAPGFKEEGLPDDSEDVLRHRHAKSV